ncbi:twin-arginine translocase TatA/TatE family subunit [Caulobacter sp. NIBR1757]|uniref:twin-arginine translocase TatA/TatE family subunit n=1 Tax=Caulobacter sp. NIBR1757 TaxID=3016000 RepID=UPI0022F0CBC9|nr:twin-arginine translocase TatA/TatE family subunit [Caulobacter sp. NIBR1757]WGM38667.1 Sec-independent protein translocase protein TatA [Caulobacter sp. NIBR1757]
MGSFSVWHIVIVLGLAALLFGGRGKLSGLMGDAAKGIRAFRDGLKGEEEVVVEEEPAKPLPSAKTTTTTARKKSNIVN